ncbi:MAG: NFACT RNA binding domain-containing protein [Candidatus Nanoarchaeia archaeon]|nr:NFACT RNA binding domain-containing protein [Candidatus Nanoarchaeia archaeon]
MEKITLDIKKSVEQNASIYFEKSKKSKKKLEGALNALKKSKEKLELLKEKKQKADVSKKENETVKSKKEWYEKFRWFYSSEGFLCIGGRDATTNDIIIKKHAEKDDVVFHTDMAGSPFFVIKAYNKKIGEATMQETAQATASYSRGWRLGLSTLDVFYVKPEQLTKTPRSGEYIGKGAFIVKGKTEYLHPNLQAAIGIKNEKIIGGPVNAIKKNSDKFIIINQGKEKASDTAKKIKKIIGGDLDEIIAFIPPGGSKIQKPK